MFHFDKQKIKKDRVITVLTKQTKFLNFYPFTAADILSYRQQLLNYQRSLIKYTQPSVTCSSAVEHEFFFYFDSKIALTTNANNKIGARNGQEWFSSNTRCFGQLKSLRTFVSSKTSQQRKLTVPCSKAGKVRRKLQSSTSRAAKAQF